MCRTGRCSAAANRHAAHAVQASGQWPPTRAFTFCTCASRSGKFSGVPSGSSTQSTLLQCRGGGHAGRDRGLSEGNCACGGAIFFFLRCARPPDTRRQQGLATALAHRPAGRHPLVFGVGRGHPFLCTPALEARVGQHRHTAAVGGQADHLPRVGYRHQQLLLLLQWRCGTRQRSTLDAWGMASSAMQPERHCRLGAAASWAVRPPTSAASFTFTMLRSLDRGMKATLKTVPFSLAASLSGRRKASGNCRR